MKTIAKLTTVLFLALVVVLLTLTSIALAGPANSTARPESKVLWPQARPLAAAPITYTLDVTATNVLTGVYESSVAWGDYDNDGDLDILLTGAGSGGPLAKLYENTGSGFAENITASNVLTGVEYSSVAWGDYDNDGDLDILLTGDTGGYNPLTSVYENTGAGFSVDAVASNDLAQVRYSSVAWGDYDNDGDLDILLTGMSSGGALAE
ncbi:MAG: VCBS repeat-containing protein, partial [Chloroflexi bacterium]|nr:VCBS repeat-containing protein [Chloroflexota bacterium]